MVSLPRRHMDPAEAQAFVQVLERHRSELVRYHMQLPLKSPARAAIKTLMDQQAEIVTLITGDRDHFRLKPHTDRH